MPIPACMYCMVFPILCIGVAYSLYWCHGVILSSNKFNEMQGEKNKRINTDHRIGTCPAFRGMAELHVHVRT